MNFGGGRRKTQNLKKNLKKNFPKNNEQHADLLESSHMPALLLQLVAHVSANRVVLSRWSQGENGAASAIAYPDSLHRWASSQFRGIKRRQALLLGVKGSLSGEEDDEEEGGKGGEMEEGAWAAEEPLASKL